MGRKANLPAVFSTHEDIFCMPLVVGKVFFGRYCKAKAHDLAGRLFSHHVFSSCAA